MTSRSQSLCSNHVKLIGSLLLAAFGIACSHGANEGASTAETVPVAPLSIDLCGNTWATRNHDVATYRNGDLIPQVQDPTAWVNLTTGAWCWYNNDSASYAATYGRLYNWYAVNDPRGLAPEGWHVLSDVEWDALQTCLGDSVGYRMRKMGTGHWSCPGTAADNSSGLTVLPGGMRSDSGTFSLVGQHAVYWTSTEGGASDAWCGRLIHHVSNAGVNAMVTGVGYMNKADGYSVRCVKDR